MARAAETYHPMHARRRPVRRQRVRLFMAFTRAMFFFAVFGGLAYAFVLYLVESPRLLVQDIPVSGTVNLSQDAVRDATGVTMRSNLLLVKPSAVRKRVEQLPEVRACRVRRDFPATLLVNIEERVPLLTLLVNNHAFTVDREGVVLRALGQFESYEGPLVTQVPNVSAPEPGQRIQEPALREVLSLWEAFRAVPLAETLEVAEIAAPHPDDIRMICEGVPFVLVWGRSNYQNQVYRLDHLWRKTGGLLPCLHTLDLRFDTDLVCR